jgi:hypothetical protein
MLLFLANHLHIRQLLYPVLFSVLYAIILFVDQYLLPENASSQLVMLVMHFTATAWTLYAWLKLFMEQPQEVTQFCRTLFLAVVFASWCAFWISMSPPNELFVTRPALQFFLGDLIDLILIGGLLTFVFRVRRDAPSDTTVTSH